MTTRNGYLVIFDTTHSIQQPVGRGESSVIQTEFGEYWARAVVDISVTEMIIKIQQDTDNAQSDGSNMISPNKL